MLGLFITLVLILSNVVSGQQRCDCNKHPQTAYCEADFVMKVKILGTIERNFTESDVYRRKYDFVIIKRYKTTEDFANIVTASIGILNVAYSQTGCGAELDINQKYIVTGHIENGQLNMFPCDWYQQVGELTTVQIIGLYKSYRANCKCQVLNTGIGKPISTCSMSSSPNFTTECYNKHALCLRRNYRCSWKIDRENPECQL